MFLLCCTEIVLSEKFHTLFMLYLHSQASNFGLLCGHSNLSLQRNLSLHIWNRCNKILCSVHKDLAWRRLIWNRRKWPLLLGPRNYKWILEYLFLVWIGNSRFLAWIANFLVRIRDVSRNHLPIFNLGLWLGGTLQHTYSPVMCLHRHGLVGLVTLNLFVNDI